MSAINAYRTQLPSGEMRVSSVFRNAAISAASGRVSECASLTTGRGKADGSECSGETGTSAAVVTGVRGVVGGGGAAAQACAANIDSMKIG